MNSLRKKLGGLIPSDGARDALQNVLTVEWAGHKTVLVEVPAMPGSGSASASGSMSSRFNGGGEMEMSGMGRDRERPRGEYERLDGWFDEDERAYLNRPVESHRRSSASATAQASSGSGSGSASGQRRPPAAHSRSLPASAAKKLPPLPARPTTANPFEDDEDDFFPDPVGPQQHYRQRQMAEETEWDYPSSLSHWGGEWRPAPGSASASGQAAGPGGAAGKGGGKKKENPWKVEERFGVASVTSPTFSMGSQSSKATSRESEDPFR